MGIKKVKDLKSNFDFKISNLSIWIYIEILSIYYAFQIFTVYQEAVNNVK